MNPSAQDARYDIIDAIRRFGWSVTLRVKARVGTMVNKGHIKDDTAWQLGLRSKKAAR
jgi:hypothetical protein